MKKQILIWLGIVIIIVITGSLLIIRANKIKKNNEIEVSNINTKLAFFSDNKILESTNNELEQYLNNLLILDSLDITTKDIKLDDIRNVRNTISKLKTELKKHDLSLYDKDINQLINDYDDIEKETILNIYDKNKAVTKKEENCRKLENYIEKTQENIAFLNFLLNKKDDYYIENGKVIFKNDAFKEEFKKFSKDIQLEKQTPQTPIRKEKTIPTLMYHGVLDIPWGMASLFVKVSEFDEQMNYLIKNGYTPIFTNEIEGDYEKPIIITFDDGYVDLYTNAFPILKKYNIKSNMNVVTLMLGGPAYLNSTQVKELSDSNLVEIGSHTLSHHTLANLSNEEVEKELRDSKQYLENLLGKTVSTIAYPGGSYNDNTVEITKKYYDYALTTNPGKNTRNSDRYTLKRINIKRGLNLKTFISKIEG